MKAATQAPTSGPTVHAMATPTIAASGAFPAWLLIAFQSLMSVPVGSGCRRLPGISMMATTMPPTMIPTMIARMLRHMLGYCISLVRLRRLPSLALPASGLSLRELAAGGDGPDGLDFVAAAGVEPVIEVHARIAMRHDELDALAERRQLAARFAGECAELIAASRISQTGPALGFSAIGCRGVDRFRSRIDRHAIGMRGIDDGGEHREARLKIGIDRLAAGAADLAVVDVHEDVRAHLQLGEAVDLAVDVVRAGAAAGENLGVEAGLLKQVFGLDGLANRFARDFLASLEADGVRGMAGVGLNALDLQALRAGDVPGQFEGRLAGQAARAAVAHVEVDEHQHI